MGKIRNKWKNKRRFCRKRPQTLTKDWKFCILNGRDGTIFLQGFGRENKTLEKTGKTGLSECNEKGEEQTMKSTGIVRGVDGLGRIVLPKELRNSMKLNNDAKLEIFVDGDEIILKKYRPTGSCDFCGEVDDDAVQYAGYCICSECRKKIGAL